MNQPKAERAGQNFLSKLLFRFAVDWLLKTIYKEIKEKSHLAFLREAMLGLDSLRENQLDLAMKSSGKMKQVSRLAQKFSLIRTGIGVGLSGAKLMGNLNSNNWWDELDLTRSQEEKLSVRYQKGPDTILWQLSAQVLFQGCNSKNTTSTDWNKNLTWVHSQKCTLLTFQKYSSWN